MTALNPGDRIDRFIVQQQLGRGGMATTYLAADSQTGQTVVLKFPDPQQLGDVATYRRFEREIDIGQKLQHPALPQLVAARADGPHPYVAFTWVAGEPLSERLRSGPLTVPEVEGIAKQLADALAYCHQHGVVHRDLKPENLLMGPDGQLHLIDFGIANAAWTPRITWGTFSGWAGSPAYMAPEIIRGERGTAQADVYAYGITLYELLMGRVPYRAENPLDAMHLHLVGTAEPLMRQRPDLPLWLAAFVAGCMRRRTTERYVDGTELCSELQDPEGVDLSLLVRPDQPIGGRMHKIERNFLPLAWLAAGLALAITCALLGHFLTAN